MSRNIIISVAALLVSIIAIAVSMRTATSDFQAEQAVKRDTAELLATFRSLAYKGVVYRQQPKEKRDDCQFSEFVNIAEEKSKIQKFLTSPTALAYYEYASKKSEQAKKEGLPEKWRTFFLRMTELLQESNPYSAATKAMDIEKDFFNFSEEAKFNEVAVELAKLSKVIENANKIRESDIVLKALIEISKSSFDESKFEPFIRFLKEKKNVKDPNIDLFLAVFENDEILAKSALDSGADLRVTSAMIVRKYEDYWKEFNNQHR